MALSIFHKKVAVFLGWSNTGKTTLIESLLRALVQRNIPCAALKCTRHPGKFQAPDKDSTRFFDAGAESALMGGPETVLALRSPKALDAAFLDRLFPGAQIVLIEGGELDGALRILVAGGAQSELDLKYPLETIDALVTGDPALADLSAKKGIRCLAPDKIDTFLDFLEERHGT